MRALNERQKGFEGELKRIEEAVFRLTARRNKLFGRWAAGRLGLGDGVDAEEYAMSVVAADFDEPGDRDVIRKVLGDFQKKGIATSEDELRAELSRAAAEARRQMAAA